MRMMYGVRSSTDRSDSRGCPYWTNGELVTCCRRFFRRREREVAAQWLQAARVTRSTALNRVDGQRETVECQGTLMDYSKVKYGPIEVEHKKPTENLSEKKKATEYAVCLGDAQPMQSYPI